MLILLLPILKVMILTKVLRKVQLSLMTRHEALKDADFVYVKNWSNYNDYGKIVPVEDDWMLNNKKLEVTNNAKVMHCLPVRRNVELSDEVLDGAKHCYRRSGKPGMGSAGGIIEYLKRIIMTQFADNKEKLFIIKIGGNVIDDSNKLDSFLNEFSNIEGKKILVHGGGKIATGIGEKLNIQSKYIDGRRITDDETIDLVTMVYGGLVNKKIVAKLQSMKLQCHRNYRR